MIPADLDFNNLKRTVSIHQVLTARGLASNLRACAGRLVGPCPLHGGDNPRAFVVHPERPWSSFRPSGQTRARDPMASMSGGGGAWLLPRASTGTGGTN